MVIPRCRKTVPVVVFRHCIHMHTMLPAILLSCLIAVAGCRNVSTSSAAQRITYHAIAFDTYRVSIQKEMPHLYWYNTQAMRYGSIEALRQQLADEGKQLLFATNAGMYTPEHTPVGLHIENGQILQPLNTQDGQGNFFLKPNGVFSIGKSGKASIVESSLFTNDADTLALATQSGPLLLSHGVIHAAFNVHSTSTYIRSGVGVVSDSVVFFAISNAPVTLYHFATFFRDILHCTDALYLDGYVSRMYIPALERYEIDGDFTGIIGIVAPQTRRQTPDTKQGNR